MTSKYATPALEKGLDILELLAQSRRPMNHSEIAEACGRSKNELFRMVVTLQERGYIEKEGGSDGFVLTDRLFRLGLGVRHVRSLTDCATPRLVDLAQRTAQSAHLVVVRGGRTAIVASFSGSSDMYVTLKLGFWRIAADSTSGQIIMAFQPQELRDRMLDESVALLDAPPDRAALLSKLAALREAGFERHDSRDFVGVSDICCPILDHTGSAIAAVIVSFVNRHGARTGQDDIVYELSACCAEISRDLGAPKEVLRIVPRGSLGA